ncbi:MAG: carbon starvation protein A [Paludibacteraceae bacterium]|nr:carbon starvation protein A [Paludibacteraceae bacterium]MBR4712350.1 carbon starvation protein A [Paludibacteraceae bacterium]
MVTFIISMLALVAGYLVYGKLVERIFSPDPSRVTPALSMQDGVDYIPLPTWKIFMIQFLNIAGTGPIFGAIMGAKFGPSAYLWIVLGCIFAGAVHDYFSGMLSIRNGGAGLPELIGKYLGQNTKKVMLIFTVFLMLMVGAVFVYSPALILGNMTQDYIGNSVYVWCGIIFLYYLIATLMPIDKIIGKIYPIFAFAIIFMAVALGANLFIKWPTLPELYETGVSTLSFNGMDIFPALFITIACGAISGFHATQSPLMARCIKNEKYGRPVFYGGMITEGIVALIWATISMYFFYGGGAEELGVETSLQAPQVVTAVSEGWLGLVGGILALMGVVAAPITSGDTALRSARLIVAEFLHMEQKSIRKRLYICVPMFAITMGLLAFNISDKEGFNVIWNYFGWSNQTLSVFTLWTITVYLVLHKKCFWITFVPAVFMTTVSVSFLLISKDCIGLEPIIGYTVGAIAAVASCVIFFLWYNKKGSKQVES